MKIFQDTKEKQGWFFEPDQICIGTERKRIYPGDYMIEGFEDKFSIERKSSVGEIAKNFTQDWFKREMKDLTAIEHSFVICEFSYTDVLNYPHSLRAPKKVIDKVRLRPAFLKACINAIRLKCKTQFIFAGTRDAAMDIAYDLMKRTYEHYQS